MVSISPIDSRSRDGGRECNSRKHVLTIISERRLSTKHLLNKEYRSVFTFSKIFLTGLESQSHFDYEPFPRRNVQRETFDDSRINLEIEKVEATPRNLCLVMY